MKMAGSGSLGWVLRQKGGGECHGGTRVLLTMALLVSGKQYQERHEGTSLVAQWLRICLPMQGTRVQSLVGEDPTCRRATKPMHHNY